MEAAQKVEFPHEQVAVAAYGDARVRGTGDVVDLPHHKMVYACVMGEKGSNGHGDIGRAQTVLELGL